MALTAEQEQALNELLGYVPAPKAQSEPKSATFLETWLGVSDEQIQARLLSLVTHKKNAEEMFLDWVEENPLDAVFVFLGAAASAFYRAEKGINPRIVTYTDSFYYISTCASVGYADIFAVTQTGKAIASLVMIIGPALADRSLNRPKPEAGTRENS